MNDLILMRVLQCATSSDGLIGRSGMLKLLRGQHSRKFAKYGLDHIPEFGSLSYIDKSEILTHIDYMLERGCLQIGMLLFPMIQITDTGKARLSKMIEHVESQVVKVEQPQIELDKIESPVVKQSLIELEAIHVCNETDFWKLFPLDLEKAKASVVIVSGFVSEYRVNMLIPFFEGLIRRGVWIKVYIRATNKEIELKAIERLRNIRVEVVFNNKIHQKIAIIDNSIVWEGSLNILSAGYSSNEQMTRFSDPEHVRKFINVIW